MGSKAFGFGQQSGVRTENTQGLLRVLLHCDEFDEVVDAEAAADTRCAAGWQRVVGSGNVVAHGLRGPAAYKDRAGVPHPVEVAGGIYGEVFGRETIGDGVRFVYARCNDDQAVAVEGLARDRIFAAPELCLGDDLFGEISTRGDEDGQRLWIVFSLRDEVGGNISRVAVFAGDYDFRGACEHVDGAVEGD